MNILVVYGGKGLSKEADISQKSGKEIIDALKEAGFEISSFELTKDNVSKLKSILKDFDVIFPVLHGTFGEDGQIQKILEETGVKYVGCDSVSSKLCFDKNLYKTKLRETGILTPDWWILNKVEDIHRVNAPVVIKPISGGASIDMIVSLREDELDLEEIKKLLIEYGELMVEKHILGQEVAVGVLSDEALPVVEIIPKGEWFDLESKYSHESEKNIPPKHVDSDMQKKLQDLALQIHRLMGCRHLSRTDMIIKDDLIYVLETNTMPGMTSRSLYPMEAKAAGYEISDLVSRLVKGVI